MYGIELYVVLYLDILVFAICVFIYKNVMADINERYARKAARKIRLNALHELVILFRYNTHRKANMLKRRLGRKLRKRKNVSNSEV